MVPNHHSNMFSSEEINPYKYQEVVTPELSNFKSK